ncbi:hypothetical protein ACET9I_02360 [Aeromonas veronii]|uniref:hypothetical protein n=1 Tax=Aeromonas veronii TaxID=654 RepID=UPI002665AB3E|nr:hypothetical protein [Aeromonas veronii]MDO2435436.1 hypothetical protein [Aeromonas veronii]HDO1382969.1 hypothetical protein [Aeromonas veronii]
MLKTLAIFISIFLISLSLSSGDKQAYIIIESNTPGILGAILGGIIAGISIILSVIISLTSNMKRKFGSFNGFIDSLKVDVIALVVFLFLSLLLPYFRVAGIPLINYPNHTLLPSRDVFYTAIEITLIIISTTIIIEVLRVMLILISHFLSLTDDKSESNEN